MRKPQWILAAVFCVALAGCRCACEPVYTVRRVIDGDTLEIVDAGGIRTRVRLRSVDAPERGKPGFEAARDALAAELLGRRVLVTPHARDRYGRLIADVAPAP